MNLDIHSETRLSFDIVHGKKCWLLEANGGTWELSHYKSGTWKNLGSVKRRSWLKVLTEALEYIEANDCAG